MNFRFAAGEAIKKRPAVILTGDAYHKSRADTIMLALSTRKETMYFGDYKLADWKAAGLPQPTKAKCVIQTVDRKVVERQLGKLTSGDFSKVKQCVRSALNLQ